MFRKTTKSDNKSKKTFWKKASFKYFKPTQKIYFKLLNGCIPVLFRYLKIKQIKLM